MLGNFSEYPDRIASFTGKELKDNIRYADSMQQLENIAMSQSEAGNESLPDQPEMSTMETPDATQ